MLGSRMQETLTPGDFPEPVLIEGEETNRRNAARVIYCDLHEINEEDLLDEDFFVDTASFELLPNISDVAAGRAPKLPTSEKNQPKKSNFKKTLKRVLASFSLKSNRGYIVDSGVSFHLIAENSLTNKKRATIREIDVAIPITTANGEVKVTHQC